MNIVRFKKEEINLIMEVYSQKISTGEWKDYSISFKKTMQFFLSISHLSLFLIIRSKKIFEERKAIL